MYALLFIKILFLALPLVMILHSKSSLALWVIYIILVPISFDFNLLGISSIAKYVIPIICLLIFIFINRQINYTVILKLLSPFIFLFIAELVFIPFQTSVPIEFQLNSWTRMVINALIFPFILQAGTQHDIKYLHYYKIAFIGSTIIACVYGIIIYLNNGVNPYALMLKVGNWQEEWLMADDRLFGRSQSTFSFPSTWGCFLVLAFGYFFIIGSKTAKNIHWVCIGLVTINIFLCGVRSAIFPVLIFVFLYLILIKKSKAIIYILPFLLLFGLVFLYQKDVYMYVTSIFDKSGGTVGGSSIEMRIAQLKGCFNILGKDILVGKGYDFVNYYLQHKGHHPILLGFESSLYSILCENGLLGILIWCLFYVKLYRINKEFLQKNDALSVHLFVLMFFLYTFSTGLFYFLLYFTFVYFFLIQHLRYCK